MNHKINTNKIIKKVRTKAIINWQRNQRQFLLPTCTDYVLHVMNRKKYSYWLFHFHFRGNKHININFNLKCTGWSSRNREYISVLFIFYVQIHIPVRLHYIMCVYAWGRGRIKAACIFSSHPCSLCMMILGYSGEKSTRNFLREFKYATFQNESIFYIAMNSVSIFLFW